MSAIPHHIPRLDDLARRRWIDRHAFHSSDDRLLIGLVSDTHIPEARSTLYPELYAALRGVDLILHAGDMHDIAVLDWLEEVAPVLAVRGNGDDGSGGRPVAPDDPRLAYNQVLHVGSLRIGMTHDFPDQPYAGTAGPAERMVRHFGEHVDVVVAGDTHVPAVVEHEGVLIVNSGSPTFPRNLQTQLGTVGFLEIRDSRPEAWIEQLH